MKTQNSYRAYLLRLWWSGSPKQLCWRVLLEDARDHTLIGFNSLQGLFAYLLELTGENPSNPSSASTNDPSSHPERNKET